MASSKRSLTLLAPTPTNISTKSEPDIVKKGTPASPATAFAKRVFPVPGGPTNIIPLGILAPSLVYFPGSFKKSTTSASSSFSSSSPATFEKFTFAVFTILALLLPKFIILLLPPAPPAAIFPFIYITKNITMTAASNTGNTVFVNMLSLGTSSKIYVIFLDSIFLMNSFTSDIK